MWLPVYEQRNKEMWDSNSKVECGRKKKQTITAHFQQEENDENELYEQKKDPILKWTSTQGWMLNSGTSHVNFGVHQLNISHVLSFGTKQDQKIVGCRLKKTGPNAFEEPEMHTFKKNTRTVEASQEILSSSMQDELMELAALDGEESDMMDVIDTKIRRNQHTEWSDSLIDYEKAWIRDNHERLAQFVGLEGVQEVDWNIDLLREFVPTD